MCRRLPPDTLDRSLPAYNSGVELALGSLFLSLNVLTYSFILLGVPAFIPDALGLLLHCWWLLLQD